YQGNVKAVNAGGGAQGLGGLRGANHGISHDTRLSLTERCHTPGGPATRDGCRSVSHNGLMATRIVIIGGGPGGYEAALVAVKNGAEVTLVERQGLGGNAVLTDVVPSKTVIATAEWRTFAD